MKEPDKGKLSKINESIVLIQKKISETISDMDKKELLATEAAKKTEELINQGLEKEAKKQIKKYRKLVFEYQSSVNNYDLLTQECAKEIKLFSNEANQFKKQVIEFISQIFVKKGKVI